MNEFLLPPMSVEECQTRVIQPVTDDVLSAAKTIVDQVRNEGQSGLTSAIQQFEGRTPDPLLFEREALGRAFERLPQKTQDLLRRTADRIKRFAEGQKRCLTAFETAIPGGVAGHDIAPIERAGCYAPGGRFPLPSSVLMTALTARVAGVESVWVATPNASDTMLGAAWIAGADGVLHAGGAQAIAALAYGVGGVPAVDIIVGPGNAWVTAAKQWVSGTVAIDMLAGPSELVVVGDASSDAAIIAADLLAQAEHDPEAVPTLVTTSSDLGVRVQAELERQLAVLPTAETARAALKQGAVVVCQDEDEVVEVVDRLAPEHLEVQVAESARLAARFRHYGGLFIGRAAAEVIGDYGAGPNHVLPTGGTARYTGGLSVLTFLRVRTWMRIDRPEESGELLGDAQALGELEGLAGHARSAAIRRS
jgi:histidinol dehydrogenase